MKNWKLSCLAFIVVWCASIDVWAVPFVYPVNGQSIDFEGDYLVKATTIGGASGYLIAFSQNGTIVYENYRDDKTLSQTIGLARGNPFRTKLLPNVPTVLGVRGLVNGKWTDLQEITIYLAPRKSMVRVLELKYFPLDAAGNLDATETDIVSTLSAIETKVNSLSAGLRSSLQNSTINARRRSLGAYLAYQKVASKTFKSKVPRSVAFAPSADHFSILNGVNICNYVDNLGVRDVWIWMYHTDIVEPIESNMSMGRISSAWFNNDTYGDISNSHQQNDLPACQHTYVVYNFNYGRGVGEALHNYGHQREWLMIYADSEMFSHFVNPYGRNTTDARACGNVHFAPNSNSDYDWGNSAIVPSYCSDWHPDGSGKIVNVSCNTWGCAGDTQRSYLLWWMQRFPGIGTTLDYQGIRLRNWLEFLADFDHAIANGRRLTE